MLPDSGSQPLPRGLEVTWQYRHTHTHMHKREPYCHLDPAQKNCSKFSVVMTITRTLMERLTSAPYSSRSLTAAVCLFPQATQSGDCPIYITINGSQSPEIQPPSFSILHVTLRMCLGTRLRVHSIDELYQKITKKVVRQVGAFPTAMPQSKYHSVHVQRKPFMIPLT